MKYEKRAMTFKSAFGDYGIYERNRKSTCHIFAWDSPVEIANDVCLRHKPDYISFPTETRFEGRKMKSWEEVARCVSAPWKQGVEIVEEMLKELASINLPKPRRRARRMRWDEEGGDEICTDRYMRAQPYFRLSQREQASGPQIISMIVNISGNAYLTPKQLLWRGALAVALANIVEEHGYRAEIMTYDFTVGTYRSGDDNFQTVMVKRSEDPMNIASLVNAVSAWFFRTVAFGSYSLPKDQQVTGGLGSARELPTEFEEEITHEKAWNITGAYNLTDSIKLGAKFLSQLSDEAVPQQEEVSTW